MHPPAYGVIHVNKTFITTVIAVIIIVIAKLQVAHQYVRYITYILCYWGISFS